MNSAAGAPAQAESQFSDDSTQPPHTGYRPVVLRSRCWAAASGWRARPRRQRFVAVMSTDGSSVAGRLRRSVVGPVEQC
mgnify:CR=1 FL=1